jgi:hypothetical protein
MIHDATGTGDICQRCGEVNVSTRFFRNGIWYCGNCLPRDDEIADLRARLVECERKRDEALFEMAAALDQSERQVKALDALERERDEAMREIEIAVLAKHTMSVVLAQTQAENRRMYEMLRSYDPVMLEGSTQHIPLTVSEVERVKRLEKALSDLYGISDHIRMVYDLRLGDGRRLADACDVALVAIKGGE